MQTVREIDNRNIGRSLLGAGVGPAAAGPLAALHAQTAWPSKPIRAIVGFAVGGGVDLMARTLAVPLAELLGQQAAAAIFSTAPGLLSTMSFKKRFADMTAEAIHIDTAKFRQLLST